MCFFVSEYEAKAGSISETSNSFLKMKNKEKNTFIEGTSIYEGYRGSYKK